MTRPAPPAVRLPRAIAMLAVLASLAGCSAGVGVSVPLVPGVSVGLGVGSGGVNVGVGTGVGPLGVGVGVNQRGVVTGGVGVGASTPVGGSGARVGVGVGTGTVLYDPNDPQHRRSAQGTTVAPVAGQPVQRAVVVPSGQ